MAFDQKVRIIDTYKDYAKTDYNYQILCSLLLEEKELLSKMRSTLRGYLHKRKALPGSDSIPGSLLQELFISECLPNNFKEAVDLLKLSKEDWASIDLEALGFIKEEFSALCQNMKIFTLGALLEDGNQSLSIQ